MFLAACCKDNRRAQLQLQIEHRRSHYLNAYDERSLGIYNTCHFTPARSSLELNLFSLSLSHWARLENIAKRAIFEGSERFF
jgi:hypothetical protein